MWPDHVYVKSLSELSIQKRIQLHSFFTSALDKGKPRAPAYLTLGKEPHHPLNKSPGGPERGKIPLRGRKMSLRGSKMSSRGRKMSLRGRKMSLRGRKIPLRGRIIPSRGRKSP